MQYGHVIGKGEADSDVDANLTSRYGIHLVLAVTSLVPLTSHSNGAVGQTDAATLAAFSAHTAANGHIHGVIYG